MPNTILFESLVVQSVLPEKLNVSVQFGFQNNKNCMKGTVPPNLQSTDTGLYSSSTLGPVFIVEDQAQFFESILSLKIKRGCKTLYKGPPPSIPGFGSSPLLATVDLQGQVSFSYNS